MIWYFSGTGNSAYIAQGMSMLLHEPVTCLNQKIRQYDLTIQQNGTYLVIVFPVYAGRIPKLLEEWLLAVPLKRMPVYFVGTCSHIAGNIEPYLKRLAYQKQLRYMGFAPIYMPQNHITLYDADSPAQAVRKLRLSVTVTQYLSEIIRNHERFPERTPTFREHLLSDISYHPFYRVMVGASRFHNADSCTGCGLCVKRCPLCNIRMFRGKPVWGNHCTHCMACIGRCPQGAIEYGSQTIGKRRYHCNRSAIRDFRKERNTMNLQEILDRIAVPTHSSICIRSEQVIYIDPIEIQGTPHDADVILLTHDHSDHFSPEDIQKVINSQTVIVVPTLLEKRCKELASSSNRIISVCPNQRYKVNDILLETVPAYNLIKPFHPKSKGWVGYILTLKGIRCYIAGDTDLTTDSSTVACDIAIVPIGGTFTMNAKQAAELVNRIHPKAVIPVHYGTIVGKPEDVTVFKSAVSPEILVEKKLQF
mgnify:CR=1 FL=1